ncbi:hypothetical protein [uncultured Microbulbifer sp.]|uniref:hypothetical protein n=1 Tax=uncultured Microbulbifer sp. TaxID=348147 RepID=UPI002614517F|nr:hypothetical protein [uncultured Microbulbifer sp.]
MKRMLTIFSLVMPAVLPVWSQADDYEVFKDKLKDHANTIKSSVSFYESSAVYSKKTIENNILLLDNGDLRQATQDLLFFLRQQQANYYQLPFDQWLAASEDLLNIDQWMSTESAWGNLVVKINVCNKVLYSAFEFLENRRSELDAQKMEEILTLLRTLRTHLPSRMTMYEIALRHYGQISPRKIRPLGFDVKAKDEGVVLNNFIENYFSGKEDAEIKIQIYHTVERGIKITDYLDLYENPVPWGTADSAKYHHYAWVVYLFAKIVQAENLQSFDWGSLESRKVEKLLKEEYEGKDQYWMPKFYREYFEKQYRANLIDTVIKTGKFLHPVRDDRNLAEQRKKSGDKKRKLLKRFSPHTLP